MSVHSAHCCRIHGCKYGDTDCPVCLGTENQDHPCEVCNILKDEATTTIPDADLKEAVAKKLGWKLVEYSEGGYVWQSPDGGHNNGILPDFPNSLDACEPVKKWLRERGWDIIVYIDDDGVGVSLHNQKQRAWKTAFEPSSESHALCLAFMEVEE